MTATPVTAESPDSLAALRALAVEFAHASRAPLTRHSYERAWCAFDAWTRAHRLTSLPATSETVSLYLAHLASRSLRPTTVARVATAIAQHHLDRGHRAPTHDPHVQRVLRGIRRSNTSSTSKSALGRADVASAFRSSTCLRDVRDRAIVLLAFATGMRRSEVVALDVDAVEFVDGGLVVAIRISKSGKSRSLYVESAESPDCAVAATKRWLDTARITNGPLFRRVTRSGRVLTGRMNSRVVARAVKRAATVAGLDPRTVSAHSLRSGFATDAARRNVPEITIMQALGHTTLAMTARYVRSIPKRTG